MKICIQKIIILNYIKKKYNKHYTIGCNKRYINIITEYYKNNTVFDDHEKNK